MKGCGRNPVLSLSPTPQLCLFVYDVGLSVKSGVFTLLYIGFTAPGSSKIGPTFSASFYHRFNYALFQQMCSKEQQIPANRFPFVTVVFPVLKINVIVKDFQESLWAVDPLYLGCHFFEGKCGYLILVVYPMPGVKMLVGVRTAPSRIFTPSEMQAKG